MQSNHDRFPVVTLDGPACAGKSTMARYLAGTLPDFAYLDTGAIYRAMALAASRKRFAAADMAGRAAEIIQAVRDAGPKIRYDNGPDGCPAQTMTLDGKSVPDADLRTPAISEFASVISTAAEIRAMAMDISRAAARERPIVVDGRDAGTALFPDAEVKFYLWAPVGERAARRQAQEIKQFRTGRPLEDIQREMSVRDERDSKREHDPLKFPVDAVWIDTGGYLEETVMKFLKDAAAARLDPDAARII